LDIICTRTPKNGYFLGERSLQLAEIRLLTDAVLSAAFISPKKSMDLVDKLQEMCSVYQKNQLQKQLYIDRRNKHSNEEIYYTIDKINHAIANKLKITFDYGKRMLTEKGQIVSENKTFTVSPYALLWYDDRYYVIGNNEKYDNLMHMRLDRMRKVTVTDKPCRSFEEVSPYRGHFDVADYGKKLANAFGGTPMVIELLCDSDKLELILDRFGEDISFRRRSDGKFSFRTEMAISDGLVGDIVRLGSGIEVLSPKILREKVTENLEKLMKVYKA
jgi:predicted DNA-binding transcriptional regulator YafY